MPLQQKQFLMPVFRKPQKLSYSTYTQQLQPYNHYRKTLDCNDCPGKGQGGWEEIYRDNCCRPTLKSGTTVVDKGYYPTQESYLYSRCTTYDQRATTLNINGSTAKSSCTNNCPIVYKRSNEKFAKQGAVSSSNRLFRLKYDTLASRGKYRPGTINKSLKDGRQTCTYANTSQNKTICK